jgi:hypothetical protein
MGQLEACSKPSTVRHKLEATGALREHWRAHPVNQDVGVEYELSAIELQWVRVGASARLSSDLSPGAFAEEGVLVWAE